MDGDRVARRVRQLLAALLGLHLFCATSGFALDMSALRHGGVLRVGTAGDYAPFTLARGEQFQGFDVDLVARLARDLGARIEYVRFRWPDLSDDLRADRFDIAVSGVTVRPERALVGRYTRPYAVSGAVALIRTEDRARFPERGAFDRPDVRIVVNRGGYLEQVAHRLFPHAAVETVADNRALPERVLLGTADAALTDGLEARSWARKEFASVGPFTRDRKAIFVGPEAPELRQWIDGWLRQRERDGWLRGLRKRWFGDTMLAAASADREAVLTDIELRCRLMPMVAATKVAHALPFEDREQEQRVLDRARALARETGIDAGGAVRLFSTLIQAAKTIQVASGTDPHAFAPPLEQLRSAIADLDAHLIRQLRAAARTVKPAEWRAGVREGVQADNLSDAYKAAIAESLVTARTVSSSTAKPKAAPAR
ncbi:MAG TPA: transporter substrate-binding domain-containing protein [Candidatus Kryptonia bacterium]|nr:transporter substrate-binding domain-containing protein [Candidatus Kryptonia bacterium]